MAEHTSKAEASRFRILDAASKSFRTGGYGGIGVDGLVKGAGLTSGAFYFHFRSKLDAFIAALHYSLDDLVRTIQSLQEDKGSNWLAAWIDYYLGFKRTCSLEEGCSFPTLTPEVERVGANAQEAYEQELERLIYAVTQGLPSQHGKRRRENSIAMLAMLSGGVNMARAVKDAKLSEEIAGAVRKAAIVLSQASHGSRTGRPKPRVKSQVRGKPKAWGARPLILVFTLLVLVMVQSDTTSLCARSSVARKIRMFKRPSRSQCFP